MLWTVKSEQYQWTVKMNSVFSTFWLKSQLKFFCPFVSSDFVKRSMTIPKHESMTRRRFLLFLFKDFNMSFKENLVKRMKVRSFHIRCMAYQTHEIIFLNIVTILAVVQARQIGENIYITLKTRLVMSELRKRNWLWVNSFLLWVKKFTFRLFKNLQYVIISTSVILCVTKGTICWIHNYKMGKLQMDL